MKEIKYKNKTWIIFYLVLTVYYVWETLYLYTLSIKYKSSWEILKKFWLIWVIITFFILMLIFIFHQKYGNYGKVLRQFTISLGYIYSQISIIIGYPIILFVYIHGLSSINMFINNPLLLILWGLMTLVIIYVGYCIFKKKKLNTLLIIIGINLFFPFIIAQIWINISSNKEYIKKEQIIINMYRLKYVINKYIKTEKKIPKVLSDIQKVSGYNLINLPIKIYNRLPPANLYLSVKQIEQLKKIPIILFYFDPNNNKYQIIGREVFFEYYHNTLIGIKISNSMIL